MMCGKITRITTGALKCVLWEFFLWAKAHENTPPPKKKTPKLCQAIACDWWKTMQIEGNWLDGIATAFKCVMRQRNQWQYMSEYIMRTESSCDSHSVHVETPETKGIFFHAPQIHIVTGKLRQSTSLHKSCWQCCVSYPENPGQRGAGIEFFFFLLKKCCFSQENIKFLSPQF